MSLNQEILVRMIKELNKMKLADPIKVYRDTYELKADFMKAMDVILDDEKLGSKVPDEVYEYYQDIPVENELLEEIKKDEKPAAKKVEKEPEPETKPEPKKKSDKKQDKKKDKKEPEPEKEPEIIEEKVAPEPDKKPDKKETKQEIVVPDDVEKQTEPPPEPETTDEDNEDDTCPAFGQACDPKAEECKICREEYPEDFKDCAHLCGIDLPPMTHSSPYNHKLDKINGSIDMKLIEGIKYGDLIDELSKEFDRSLGKTRSVVYNHFKHLVEEHRVETEQGIDALSAKTDPAAFIKIIRKS